MSESASAEDLRRGRRALGDALGAKLMAALGRLHAGPIEYAGVGGELMEAQGLASLFPMSDVAVMGPVAILKRLAPIVRRVYQTDRRGVAFEPDAVVIIDSPEFTHPIAKRIRRQRPHIPIVDYVSPTVWAWRPGRAKAMRPYVDHLLALLPFEPEAHERLGGPPCTYVGHPLVERLEAIRALDPEPLRARLGLDPASRCWWCCPAAGASEVGRLLGRFPRHGGEGRGRRYRAGDRRSPCAAGARHDRGESRHVAGSAASGRRRGRQVARVPAR